PEHHRFPMAKYRLLRERLVAEDILTADDLTIPDPISWDYLRLGHDEKYIEAVAPRTFSADAQRRIGFPSSPVMVERSRRSVGATLAAARVSRQSTQSSHPSAGSGSAASEFTVAANLAGGTHHAFRDRGEGYCVFNDVAVAASVLLREG